MTAQPLPTAEEVDLWVAIDVYAAWYAERQLAVGDGTVWRIAAADAQLALAATDLDAVITAIKLSSTKSAKLLDNIC